MAVSSTIQEQMLEEAYSATPNYDIDYNDKRFTDVTDAKDTALSDLEQTYAGMIGKTNGFYQDQIDALEKWEDEQIALKDKQTDFEIEQINQQKDQAHKDYLKEQSASYVDWQKQSNKYGANAEQMASAGLTGTGFSESSQVSMYNTYQIRVATARESFERAKLNYDNLITEARLENNAAKAEIAFLTLQKSLELALEGFQYENELLLDKANKKIELDNMYYTRYQDVLQQINHENAIKEDIRQYNETQKWQTEQAALDRQHDEDMAKIEYDYQVKLDDAKRTFEAAEAVLDREHELAVIGAKTAAEKDILDKEWEIEKERLKEELENEKALLAYQKQLSQQYLGGVRGSNNSARRGNGDTRGSTGYGYASPTTSKTTSTTTNTKVNSQSKMSLGQGPISDAKAATLVNQGKANAYIANGQVYVTPAVSLPTSKFRTTPAVNVRTGKLTGK